jgi:hypothetical protein
MLCRDFLRVAHNGGYFMSPIKGFIYNAAADTATGCNNGDFHGQFLTCILQIQR